MMCEELEQELRRGEEAAQHLVEHLERMGADKASMPIVTDDGCYIVEVRKTL